MEESELRAIAARCEKATKGPWISFIEGRDHTCGSDFIRTAGEDIELLGATKDDQDFIAHARQDIPVLLCEIARLNRLLAARAETMGEYNE